MRSFITIGAAVALAVGSSCNSSLRHCEQNTDCPAPLWCDTSVSVCVAYLRPDAGTTGAGTTDAGATDAGTTDAGAADAGAAVEVMLSSPSGTAYVNGTVLFLATVKGATPTKVELLSNGTGLAEMAGPPYAYAWDTAGLSGGASVPEGTYSITARATVDGRSVLSQPVTVVVDRTPPTAWRSPGLPAAENIGLRSSMQVVFSEPVRSGAAGAVGVSADCGSATFDHALSTDGKTLTFQASSGLSAPCTITATLGSGVADLAGNQMSATTLTWKMPVWQLVGDPVSTNAGAYSLGVGPSGSPVVAYEEAPGSPGARIVVKAWSGSSWELLGTMGAASAVTPSLALDAQGNPTVAWLEGTASPHVVKVSQRKTGLWTAMPDPATKTSTKQGDPLHPIVVLRTDGTPCVAFGGTMPSANNIGDCVQSWNALSQAWDWWGCQANSYGGLASLVMDSGDRLLIAYTWADASGLGVLERSGDTWVPRGMTPSYGLDPALAFAHDAGVIAWRSSVVEDGGYLQKVYAKTWGLPDGGLDWAPKSSPGVLPPPLSAADAKAPSAAVDNVLGLVVAWVEPGSGYAVKRFDGNTWVMVGGRLNATPPATNLVYGPSLATDGTGGNLGVAWNMAATLYVMRHNR